MSLETALFDYLTSNAAVAAIASSVSAPDRVYRVRLPEGTVMPAVKWSQISADRRYDHNPPEDQRPWVRKRIQVDCWATTVDVCAELGEAIMRALSGYTGFMDGTFLVSSIFCINEFETYEEDTKFYRRTMDFMVSHEEALEADSSS